MSEIGSELTTTTNFCPKCLERVPGAYVARDESVYLRRTCSDHGAFDRKVWESLEHWQWARRFQPDGGFTVDNDHACLAVVEVTQDCNLSCSYCFASSGPSGYEHSTAEIHSRLETIIESGGPRPIQLSGGEKTEERRAQSTPREH